jgi:hypothetical protein
MRMPVINKNSSLNTEVDIFEGWGSSALTVRLTVNRMHRTVFVVYIVLAGNDGKVKSEQCLGPAYNPNSEYPFFFRKEFISN